MSLIDAIALALMIAGALVTVVASIGLIRFPDTLTRMHAASKPQTLGLILVILGMTLSLRSIAGLCLAILVLGAQMVTVPVSSTMLARAGFRRGFFGRSGQYAYDELSGRLAQTLDQDDDDDGFIDEDQLAPSEVGFEGAADRFPTNTVAHRPDEDLSRVVNWQESPETVDRAEPDIDIALDEEDLAELPENTPRVAVPPPPSQERRRR